MPENRENETYQFFFLKKALLEVTDTIDNIEFDEKHFEGMNVIGDFIVPVTFQSIYWSIFPLLINQKL